MQALVDYLFETAAFVPHGYCLLWRPDLVAMHGIADALIALSYFSIPAVILLFVRRRPGIQLGWLAWLFIAFIAACGITHLVGMTTIWLPVYGFEALTKLVTAAISVVTAGLMWPLLPKALALPSPEDLRQANLELQAEIGQRGRAETELRMAQQELESRVLERTRALEDANSRLSASNQELEKFAYVASHDLRAPLRALSILPNWIERDLAKESQCSSAIAEHLGDMRDQVARMDRLLTDLLQYSRIGRALGSKAKVDPRAAIADAHALLNVAPGFALIIEGELPAIELVPTEFELVMRNLISNAIKHHDRDHGRITVRGGRDGDKVFFEVEDDGPGIPAEYHEKIFDMFSTLRSRDEVEGSGIGLALVRKTVEHWGGRVGVASLSGGRGIAFRITVPHCACDSA